MQFHLDSGGTSGHSVAIVFGHKTDKLRMLLYCVSCYFLELISTLLCTCYAYIYADDLCREFSSCLFIEINTILLKSST